MMCSRWTDRIQPWVHFVPIKLDYSDLYDTLGFFRGLPDGTPGHEDLAERIANTGSQWARKYWRQEVCYVRADAPSPMIADV